MTVAVEAQSVSTCWYIGEVKKSMNGNDNELYTGLTRGIQVVEDRFIPSYPVRRFHKSKRAECFRPPYFVHGPLFGYPFIHRNGPRQKSWRKSRSQPINHGDIFSFQKWGRNRWTTTFFGDFCPKVPGYSQSLWIKGVRMGSEGDLRNALPNLKEAIRLAEHYGCPPDSIHYMKGIYLQGLQMASGTGGGSR